METLTSSYDLIEMHNQAARPNHHMLDRLNQLRIQCAEVNANGILQQRTGYVRVSTRQDGGEVHQRALHLSAGSILG